MFSLLWMAAFLLTSTAKEVVLTGKSGQLSSYNDGHNSFRIRVPKGDKIAMQLDYLNLNRESFLKIRDGLTGEARIYKMVEGDIFEMDESSDPRVASVSLPITFVTTTRKLIVYHKGINVTSGEGFSAHYTRFNDVHACAKQDLPKSPSHFSTRNITCDTEELSPVATQCNVTLDCGESYIQYNNFLSCANDKWQGHVQCYPKKEILQRCSFDFDQFETNTTCPYTTTEVVRYYLEIEEVRGVFEGTMGRGGKRKVKCAKFCAVDTNGKRIVGSCNGMNQARYVKCFICRMVSKCRLNVAFF